MQLKKAGQNWEALDDCQTDEIVLSPTDSTGENSSDKESKSEVNLPEVSKEKQSDEPPYSEEMVTIITEEPVPNETYDEGWQEAIPKGRSPTARKSSRRPNLAKINTSFMNVPQSSSSKYRVKGGNFTSPRIGSNDSSSSGSKKFIKSPGFSPKPVTPTGWVEKIPNQKPASPSPASATVDHITPKQTAPVGNPVSVQAAGKLFSYKEVALAPPGSIVKAVAEQLPKEDLQTEETLQMVQEKVEAFKAAETKEQVGEEMDKLEDSKTVNEKSKVIDLPISEVLQPVYLRNDEPQEKTIEGCLIISTNTENTECSNGSGTQLLEKMEMTDKDGTPEENRSSHDVPCSDDDKLSPSEGAKQEENETVKEITKKLSAAAPPFNPSTVPVFGSIPVSVQGFKDHGGILPSPVNIAPMIAVNPIRRSAHQSATARVPYGPRLSGSYNRAGSRVPRNKQFHNCGDHPGTDMNSHFSPPRIMNPHAVEFVPGQPWVPNGYPLSPSSYLASPSGMPISPYGFPVSQNGIPSSINVTTVAQNGFVIAPMETSAALAVETGGENIIEAAEAEVGTTSETVVDKHLIEEKEILEDVGEKPEDLCQEKSSDTAKKNGLDKNDVAGVQEKPAKCWGDYSDTEADIVEVIS